MTLASCAAVAGSTSCSVKGMVDGKFAQFGARLSAAKLKLLTITRRAPRYNSTASCATLPVMRAMTSAKVVSRFFILMFFYFLAVLQYAHADLPLEMAQADLTAP